ncbi:MAG: hypothetical protein RJB38_1798 [Pseudomonadota bacterium]|jgi:peptide/nickel transport system permease protein
MKNVYRKLAQLWLTSWFSVALALQSWKGAPAFSIENALHKPSWPDFPMGADTYGRDLFKLVSQASLISVAFACSCVVISLALALATASLAPHLSSRSQRVLQSVLHFFLAFPSILFAFTVAGFLGPGKLTIAVALTLGAAPGLTRLLWNRSRELAQLEFIWAARALGTPALGLAFRHTLPHLASLARVKIPSLVVHALLAEASLSFLGLGFPIGQESWGSLLSQAKDYLIEAPHISLAVGIPLILTLLSLDVVSKATRPELR